MVVRRGPGPQLLRSATISLQELTSLHHTRTSDLSYVPEERIAELWEPTDSTSKRERHFLAHISVDAPLEIVLRGHLWVESALIGLIEEVLPHPEAIDLARFSFPQKLGLAVGLGLVRPEYGPAYLKLNGLRNRVAHDLFSAITHKEQEELLQALGPTLRHISGVDDDEHRFDSFPDPLRAAIATLLLELDGVRASVIKQREEMAALHERVQELRAQSERRQGQ
jgi:hypothetical protein